MIREVDQVRDTFVVAPLQSVPLALARMASVRAHHRPSLSASKERVGAGGALGMGQLCADSDFLASQL